MRAAVAYTCRDNTVYYIGYRAVAEDDVHARYARAR
eukprot:COSAG03_NODE_17021_length_386_cov_0.717770_1_plen_35_part_10